MYYFTHKKTGKHVIATDWPEFFKLDANKDFERRYRLGYNTRIVAHIKGDESSREADRINRFWAGAKGYEKIGQINAIGIPSSGPFNYIRLFLKNIRNHAAMQGDKTTYKRAEQEDSFFWENGGVHQYLLTA